MRDDPDRPVHTFFTDKLASHFLLKFLQTLCVVLLMEKDQERDALFRQFLKTHTKTHILIIVEQTSRVILCKQ